MKLFGNNLGSMAAATFPIASPGAVWGVYPERTAADRDSRFAKFDAYVSGWAQQLGAHLRRKDSPKAIAMLAKARQKELAGQGDKALRELAMTAMRRFGAGQPISPSLMAEVLAVAGDVARRTLGLTPYASQYEAAAVLLHGQLAELPTGEGKTLVAALAAAVAARAGMPVHVLTANDYLVARDADELRPFYSWFGLDVAAVVAQQTPQQRRAAYRAAVVYATAKEVAFDYLRDRMAMGRRLGPLQLRARGIGTRLLPHSVYRTPDDDEDMPPPGGYGAPRQPANAKKAAVEPVSDDTPTLLRGLCFGIIDEADSLLLDEATMPLILANAITDAEGELHEQCWKLAGMLWRQRDYRIEPSLRRVDLTEAGRLRLRELATAADADRLLRVPARVEELVRAALVAMHVFRRDRDYAVIDDKLVIIDDVTGRLAEGRAWSGGVQQMVERKESLTPTAPTETAASITFQRFFRRYIRLAGLSATLSESAAELRKHYGLNVQVIAPNARSRRRQEPVKVFMRAEQRWVEVVRQVARCHKAGKPVLVATESVAQTNLVANLLQRKGLPHQVLHAVQHAEEAAVVAAGGRSGSIIISTNMAGRGTDIKLDSSAIAAGGLTVIACQLNRARRIDRQLAGRCARRGEPGTVMHWVSLDDSVPVAMLPAWLKTWVVKVPAGHGDWLRKQAVFWAQRRAEHRDGVLRDQIAESDRIASRTIGFAGGLE